MIHIKQIIKKSLKENEVHLFLIDSECNLYVCTLEFDFSQKKISCQIIWNSDQNKNFEQKKATTITKKHKHKVINSQIFKESDDFFIFFSFKSLSDVFLLKLSSHNKVFLKYNLFLTSL